MQIEKINISKIIPYKNNAKLHPKEQIEQIKKSIQQFGNNDPIAIDENDVIIEGHGRYYALKELGYKEADIIRLSHLSEKQKKAYMLAHNQLTLNSGFDLELLEKEIQSINELNDLDVEMPEFEIDMEDYGFDLSGDYNEFLDKFEAKKTTDDCYTPNEVYEAVKNHVIEKYNLKDRKVVRPFYPGGDYENYTYPKDCVVIDNPPFSILSKIVEFYQKKKIVYFLFGPHLTLFSANKGQNYIITNSQITYENKAFVNTGFITNLGKYFIEVDVELAEKIEKAMGGDQELH